MFNFFDLSAVHTSEPNISLIRLILITQNPNCSAYFYMNSYWSLLIEIVCPGSADVTTRELGSNDNYSFGKKSTKLKQNLVSTTF